MVGITEIHLSAVTFHYYQSLVSVGNCLKNLPFPTSPAHWARSLKVHWWSWNERNGQPLVTQVTHIYKLIISLFYFSIHSLIKLFAVKKSLLRLISCIVIDEFMTLYLLVNRDLFAENVYSGFSKCRKW